MAYMTGCFHTTANSKINTVVEYEYDFKRFKKQIISMNQLTAYSPTKLPFLFLSKKYLMYFTYLSDNPGK